MDNVPTHMSQEVEDAINDKGSMLIYGAPFSPHLNPIKNYFSAHKACFKRHQDRIVVNWHEVHVEALNQVTRGNRIKCFRRYSIPGLNAILTSKEIKMCSKNDRKSKYQLLPPHFMLTSSF